MKIANVFVDGVFAGILQEVKRTKLYRFIYDTAYKGLPVSLEMPLSTDMYEYDHFPPFFEGLLPEGIMLESLLRQRKCDKGDYMSQLLAVGHDLVGNVTVEASSESLPNNV